MNWGEAGRIKVDGKELEFATFGPAPDDAPTLVMLHEGLGCVEMWRDLPQTLSHLTGFGVFVYSRAGYGKSDPVELPRPKDYMTREAEDVLPKILDVIGARRIVLLGHSDGATIAATHAGTLADMRVRGLILIAPHFFGEEMGLEAIRAAKKAYESGDLKARLSKYHRNVDATFRGWSEVWLDPTWREWNVAEVIDYLRIPTLAIQGANDAYGTRAQIDELEARSYAPVDVLWLDGCGHAPHLERREETLAAIVEYCNRLEQIEHASFVA